MSAELETPAPVTTRRCATAARWAVALSAVLLAALPAAGASLTARLVDQKGAPVENGVVIVEPSGGLPPGPRTSPPPAIMDQIDEAFAPHVLAVRVGTTVSFPNKDDIRHHVYSFSEAKRFELPLYKGVPAEPVVFGKPGEVVLGCNIHDHMRGYLLVVESPFYARTGPQGDAEIDGLATGSYEVRVWHPRQRQETVLQTVEVTDSGAALEIQVDLKAALRLRGSRARGKKY